MRIYFSLSFLFLNQFLLGQVSDFENIDFTKANNTAKLYNGASLENLPILAHNLTYKLPTDVEKFRAIYLWVCQNIKGDKIQFKKVAAKQEEFKNDPKAFIKWNLGFKKHAFEKLLKQKKTMCTGYAYLIKELCFLANIKSVIINGYARDAEVNIAKFEYVNHSWNAVQLNNKWYLCDATWSSGYLDELNSFVTDYNDGYFLTDPFLFGKSHFPSDQKWTLFANANAQKFITEPLVYAETYRHSITPTNPETMDVQTIKKRKLVFSFKTDKKIHNDSIALVRYTGLKEKKLNITNLENTSNEVSFEYIFKSKGNYDTHLMINGDIVASYIVEVTKELEPIASILIDHR